MIRPQVRSQIRPPILPQRQVLAQAVSRYFTAPEATAAQYYELSSSVVFSGNFEIEFKASTVGAPYAPFLGSELNLDNYCDLNPVNQPRIKINGNIYQATQSVPAGILDTFIFRRLDNVLYISTASGVAYSTQCSTDDFIFDFVGRRFGSTFMTGIISDIRAWSGGDRNAGDLIVDFPLDDQIPTDGIIPNRVAGDPGAPSHVVAVNLLPSDSKQHTEIDDGWVSQELWLESDVSLEGMDSNSIVINQNSCQISGNANTALTVNAGKIRVSANLESASAPIGAFRVRAGVGIAPNTDYLDVSATNLGDLTHEFLAPTDAVLWFKTNYVPGSSDSCMLSDISVVSILEVAS